MKVLVPQRKAMDCGVAALATIAEVSYEDAYVVVAKGDPHRTSRGMTNAEVIRAAKGLGLTLVATRRYDLEVDEGVLRVRWSDPKRHHDSPGGHFVAVYNGSILCPSDQSVMVPDDYLSRWKARPCTLLKLEA